MFVEQDCTIEHEGRKFTNGGAVVNNKYAIAYMSNDLHSVTTWHGKHLGTAYVKASWSMPRSWQSSRQYQVEATINGILYTGRTMGAGMVWRGKRKSQRGVRNV